MSGPRRALFLARMLPIVAVWLAMTGPVEAAKDCVHGAPVDKAAFDRLYDGWHRESERIQFSSNTSDYVSLPSYRKIVGLGPGAVPFLHKKLRQNQDIDFMLARAVVTVCGWDQKDFLAESEQGLRDKVLLRLGDK